MLIPVRCFTCGKVLGNLEARRTKLLQEGKTPKEALDALGLTRACCRTVMITYIDMSDMLLEPQERKIVKKRKFIETSLRPNKEQTKM